MRSVFLFARHSSRNTNLLSRSFPERRHFTSVEDRSCAYKESQERDKRPSASKLRLGSGCEAKTESLVLSTVLRTPAQLGGGQVCFLREKLEQSGFSASDCVEPRSQRLRFEITKGFEMEPGLHFHNPQTQVGLKTGFPSTLSSTRGCKTCCS